jgi:replicative DNA helicase
MTAVDHAGLIDRLPPSNIDAEAALLGAILVMPTVMPVVVAIVRPGDFHAPLHETIFIAITALYEKTAPIDKVGLAEELRLRGMLDHVGGVAYLSTLLGAVESASGAEYYAKLVAEKSRLRGLISLGIEVTRLGYEGESDADSAVTEAFGKVQTFVDGTSPTSRRPMNLIEAGTALDESLDGGSGIFHPTPFEKLTANIGGWKKGGLYVLGGSVKMGKSFLANTVGLHLSRTVGRVAFFPLEIGRLETQLRFEQLFSRVNALKRVRRLHLSESEWERIGFAKAELAKYPVMLYDGFPQFTTDDIIVESRRLASDGPLAGIIVDHIGFLSDVRTPHRNTTKHERLEVSLNRFLMLARQLECPVFLVWHVNRDAKDGEPSVFDLRDGGNIEGIAQTILFVRRPNWDKSDGTQREGKIIIAATRMGYAGDIPAHFDDERGIWCDSGGHSFIDGACADGSYDASDLFSN